MHVPFVDLKSQYHTIKTDIDNAINGVINEASFIGGAAVKQFEKDFSKLLYVKHCIGVANGTDAIYITLKMLGVGPGDEVITTALSWISTSETISQTGAKPVFVDIDLETYTINPEQIENKITHRTKAIIPVHLYGQAAHISKIKALCLKYDLFLIEDCAQAHLTEEHGELAGSFGVASTFSFYPGKNLGAYGDAGAVITNDDALAEKIRMYANHGALKKHEHNMEGINSRLDAIQAAILSVKAKHLSEWTDKRIRNALLYFEYLKDAKVTLPVIRAKTKHTFHLYVIRYERRDQLRAFLEKRGIQTAIHYPTALPFLPAYAYLNHVPQDFPVAYRYTKEILSLPMFPELTNEQIKYVCDAIKSFCA
ncbi:MAG TPA: DegT/DnrJ/EryC1/StrS family aminotransferase [Cyclobacteriaceae bacterium]|nr:DegT/DnrJ/EryC1/StrS family aminotransferase [Cyclobacteriaceae bacterium]